MRERLSEFTFHYINAPIIRNTSLENQKHIAVVDDDKIYMFLMQKLLSSIKAPLTVSQFENGEDAINQIKADSLDAGKLPDIIFLDINMPVMDGWEFLDEFTKLEGTIAKSPQIFVVSSSINDTDVRRSRGYSCVSDYIVKPIKKEFVNQLLGIVP